MDDEGAWIDDVFVERLGRSIGYEEVYVWPCGPVGEARASIDRHVTLWRWPQTAFEP